MNILINLTSSSKEQKNPFHGGNEYTNRIALQLIFNNKEQGDNLLYFYCSTEESVDQFLLKTIREKDNCFLIQKKECSNIEDVIFKFNILRFFDPLGVDLGNVNLSKVEVLYTIHGLRPIELLTDINEFYLESKVKYLLKRIFSNFFNKKNTEKFRKSVKLKSLTKKLIVVSEHTKNSIIALYDEPPENITVLYSPEKKYDIINILDEKNFFIKTDIEPLNYFLLVSSKRWIKNTYRAIKAFDNLIDKGLLTKKIVLTGVNDKVKKIVKNKDMFHFLDYVASNELEILYKNAFCFTYPSLNEGFGYPPLEAMKFGTPVIASMITAIPEVVGDSCLKFNPFSVLELEARIIQLQNDPILHQSLAILGKKRYELISKKQELDLTKLIELILLKND